MLGTGFSRDGESVEIRCTEPCSLAIRFCSDPAIVGKGMTLNGL